VLERELDIDALPANASPAVRQTIALCLEKDVRRRIADIRDVKLALRGAFDASGSHVLNAAGEGSRLHRPVPVALAVALLTAAATALAAWLLRPEPLHQVSRTLVTPPPTIAFSSDTYGTGIAISPDGAWIVYRASSDGRTQLFVRDLDALETRALTGSEGSPSNPFVSPDGGSIGFFDDGTLYRVSVRGGQPQIVTNAIDGDPRGATWGSDDTIVFASSGAGGLWRVSADGGEPNQMTIPTPGEGDHLWPAFIPDSGTVLFTIVPGDRRLESARIAVVSPGRPDLNVLLSGGASPRYAESGHLVYGIAGTLWAAGFDPQRLEVTTDPVPVVSDLAMTHWGGAHFSVADNGSLIYVRGFQFQGISSLVVIDRARQSETLPDPPGVPTRPRFSPDGGNVAMSIDNEDVWVLDITRGTYSKVTNTPGTDNVPVWTPDGKRLIFASLREQSGVFSFFQARADGTGAAERVMTAPGVGNLKPYTWTTNGEGLIFDYGPPQALDIGVLALAENTWEPLLESAFNESGPALSPDAGWIAYSSDETGRCEIYLQRFPGLGDRRQVSRQGGAQAVWSRDSGELFYRSGTRLMTVDVVTEPALTIGTPVVLLDGLAEPSCSSTDFDVSQDGQRLLFVQPAGPRAGAAAQVDFVLVQNWLTELVRIVPVE
jgi:Tol biopolymer transport system component